jgi:methylglutaconyl-CoA hydratase
VTKIGLPETGLGIIPGAGGTQRVTRIIGPSRAKDLIFTARPLTATQALDWGLVNYISDPDSTGLHRALTLAETMTRNGDTPSRRLRTCLTALFHSSAGITGCETGRFSF